MKDESPEFTRVINILHFNALMVNILEMYVVSQ